MYVLPTSCTARNEVTGFKSFETKKSPNLSVRAFGIGGLVQANCTTPN
jgi:hypothetical protein